MTLRPRACLRGPRLGSTRSERGSTSVQMVILMPVLFSVMFLGLQAALFYHARTVAIAAAQDGARAAGAETGTASNGTALSVIPGWHAIVQQSATVPVERITTG